MKDLADPIKRLSDGVVNARKRTLGFGRQELSKPVVAIINSYSELNLAHLGFNAVAQRVREGVLTAGGRPIESGMLAMCDAMAHGRLHEKYVLPGRDLIADAIETYINAHGVFDAMVCVGTCDKVLPAMLIAAVRVNIPTVIVTGGPQVSELNENTNRAVCAQIGPRCTGTNAERMGDEKFLKTLLLDGEISDEEFVELYFSTQANIGICRPYATAGTMNYFTEAIGLAISGSALIPELSTEKAHMAAAAGARAVELAMSGGPRPADIVTEGSIRNGILSIIATGGSMNAILHALAVANTAGINLDYRNIADWSAQTPFLIDLKNRHALDMTGFRAAGGVLGVLKRLEPRISRDVPTVDGVSLGTLLDRLAHVGEAIATADRAVSPRGAIRVLTGTLAPRGALFNSANVPADRLYLNEARRAVVFDSYDEFATAAARGQIPSRAAVLIRFEGPIGGPGMREAHRVSEVVNHLNLLDQELILITDGRYSGASNGFVIGYLAPEAAEPGSPLALVRTGDTLVIDLPNDRLDLDVPESELRRRANSELPTPPEVPAGYRYLARYRRLVGPTDRGALVV